MGPIWGRQDPGGPHVGPMNLAIWDILNPFDLISCDAALDTTISDFHVTLAPRNLNIM